LLVNSFLVETDQIGLLLICWVGCFAVWSWLALWLGGLEEALVPWFCKVLCYVVIVHGPVRERSCSLHAWLAFFMYGWAASAWLLLLSLGLFVLLGLKSRWALCWLRWLADYGLWPVLYLAVLQTLVSWLGRQSIPAVWSHHDFCSWLL